MWVVVVVIGAHSDGVVAVVMMVVGEGSVGGQSMVYVWFLCVWKPIMRGGGSLE